MQRTSSTKSCMSAFVTYDVIKQLRRDVAGPELTAILTSASILS